jgi:hypothetical protein
LRRAALLVVVLALVSASCKADDDRSTFTTTTTTRRATTTSSSATSSSSSTVVTAAPAPAPNGCDASSLQRVAPRADRTAYSVDATLDLDANMVNGTMEAAFTPDRDTDKVVLRLWPNGPSQRARGAHEEIANATLDGKPVAITMANPTTALLASGGLTPNKRVTIKVAFSLTLPGPSDDRLSRSGTTVRLGSWMPLLAWEPGSTWTLDPPTTSDAEASTTIAADFDVHFHAPAGLTVLASGQQVGDGHWKAPAMPDWGASIGRFNLVEGRAGSVPVVVGVDTTIGESPTTYLNRVVGSINALSARYGPYPYPAYTLAITPSLRGGIEYPGHVMQGPGTNTRTTPHEVAHQWFYSLVGNDQGRDPWLDEGLASWAEAMVNGSYRSFLSKSIPADGRNRIGEPMTYWDQRHDSYYRSVYVQTVQALGALGVSTAAIDCALARYVAANAYRVATPVALVRALQTVAPNARDVLARFGAQRLDGP